MQIWSWEVNCGQQSGSWLRLEALVNASVAYCGALVLCFFCVLGMGVRVQSNLDQFWP